MLIHRLPVSIYNVSYLFESFNHVLSVLKEITPDMPGDSEAS